MALVFNHTQAAAHGQRAFLAGEPASANPYTDEIERGAWDDGWRGAAEMRWVRVEDDEDA